VFGIEAAGNMSSYEKTEDRIRACIDMGSGNLRVEDQFVPAGERPSNVPHNTVQLATVQPHIELVLLYTGDHKFENLILGRESVKDWVDNHPDDACKVVEQPKLALCVDYKDSVTVKRVYEALEVQHGELFKVQDVLTHVLAFCLRKIRDHMRSMSRCRAKRQQPNQDWDNIAVELQLTVPIMWDDIARGVMRNAASDAGFKDTVLRSEPLCAAASYLAKEWNKCELDVSSRPQQLWKTSFRVTKQ
jgi:hypothetical protein